MSNHQTEPPAGTALSSTHTTPSFTFPPLYSFKPFFTSDESYNFGYKHASADDVDVVPFIFDRLMLTFILFFLFCGFSIQPTDSTWSKQRAVWLDLIRSYCQYYHIHRIQLHSYNDRVIGSNQTSTTITTIASNSTSSTSTSSSTMATLSRENRLIHQLFRNDDIERGLSISSIRLLLDHLVTDSYGLWSDDGPNRLAFLISPQYRLSEIGDFILSYVDRQGQNDSIMTLYELLHSDSSKNEPFHGHDEILVYESLRLLESRSKCRLIPSLGGVLTETGIKFIG